MSFAENPILRLQYLLLLILNILKVYAYDGYPFWGVSKFRSDKLLVVYSVYV